MTQRQIDQRMKRLNGALANREITGKEYQGFIEAMRQIMKEEGR